MTFSSTNPATNPDFENARDDRGIVATTLGSDNLPVYGNHPSGTPTTHGQTSFDQWYRDVPGVNLSTNFAITLDNTGNANPDIFTSSNGSFFPIDGRLFGNEPAEFSHNYNFTYEIHSSFTYGVGETFSFTGDDDLFVFLNKELAIDLGGVHGAESASVSLDRYRQQHRDRPWKHLGH